ncbi:MAG TPA: CPBP family intramembrane glutamic endopeptidase [Solirubrobacteraceae bacterium]|nr:CPBP family intramembrane glutamic endopeptidase [Solirubrobacteraceae bacterium]
MSEPPPNPYGLSPPQPERQPAWATRGDRPDAGERSPATAWPPWSAPAALVAGLVLAALGALVIDVPAALLGARITSSHTPPGLSIADTVVQDVGFVAAAVFFAQLGGRAVSAWQFGLRRPPRGWRAAAAMVAALIVAFVALSAVWSAIVHPEEEELLKALGSNEGTGLLVLSAALTCVVAPICEEFLFRGFIFTALRNWRGTMPAALITAVIFGGVHVGSAPALDLVPLAALGFGLCLLYRYSGSLYPCIVAHSLNNSLAFSSLENWSWQAPVLLLCALLGIAAIVLAFKRLGLIVPEPGLRPGRRIGSSA